MRYAIEKKYEVVVVGGGLSGVCAAIASARHGAKTAIIQNRPVFGGNASSEIRMHVCGAAGIYCTRKNSRETGIIEEILLENKKRNPNHSFSIFDTVLWEKINFQDNLDKYLNTQMYGVEVADGTILNIKAEQITTEKKYVFKAGIFIDATGDGTLAEQAGADYMIGREGNRVYGEPHAPDIDDCKTMGNSLMFKTVDTGHHVSFKPPAWAKHYTEEDLRYRCHRQVSSGYWWIELGGDDLNVIDDYETIRDELLKVVYGIWDHIKNGGAHEADTLDLDWVQFLPGKRESRRILGEYVLKEQDLLEGRVFPDMIAYGGWPIDTHAASGMSNLHSEPTKYIFLDDIYSIPYRCLIPKKLDNLLVAGRAVSASHLAFASLRVMGTTSVVGQAAGTAAALQTAGKQPVRSLCGNVKELQQTLLRDGCYLPGILNEDGNDLARKATVTASSCQEGYEPSAVINGLNRPVKDHENCWKSSIGKVNGQWLQMQWEQPVKMDMLQITFDSDLNEDLMITLDRDIIEQRRKSLPGSLAESFKVQLFMGDLPVAEKQITGNSIRNPKIQWEKSITADKARIIFNAVYECDQITVFEVRIY